MEVSVHFHLPKMAIIYIVGDIDGFFMSCRKLNHTLDVFFKLPWGPEVTGAFYLRYCFETMSTTCIIIGSVNSMPADRMKGIFKRESSVSAPASEPDPFV